MSFKNIFQINLNQDIDEQLSFLAGILINHSRIFFNQEKFKIIDAEIMCHVKDIHEDPWLHSSYDQLLNNTWYFHGKNSKRYGLDLTFGDVDKNIYASILLRRIKRVSDNFELNGPSEIANYFLKNLGYKNRNEFSEADNKGACKEANPNFCIETVKNLDPQKIYNVPRYRAVNSLFYNRNTQPKLNFLFKPYRYATSFKDDDSNKSLIRAWSDLNQAHAQIHKELPMTDYMLEKHKAEVAKGKTKSLNDISKVRSKLNQKLQLLGNYLK